MTASVKHPYFRGMPKHHGYIFHDTVSSSAMETVNIREKQRRPLRGKGWSALVGGIMPRKTAHKLDVSSYVLAIDPSKIIVDVPTVTIRVKGSHLDSSRQALVAEHDNATGLAIKNPWKKYRGLHKGSTIFSEVVKTMDDELEALNAE